MGIFKQLCLVVLAALFLAAGIISVSDAIPGGGRALNHGYFGNQTQPPGWDRIFQNGLTATNSKSNFIAQVMAYYNDGTANGRTGAEFVIQTMRGSTDHSRPSSADIANWKLRIYKDTVTMTTEKYSYDYNSAYMQDGNNDAMFYSDSGAYDSFVFKDSGTEKYVLKLACGNPLGDFGGLSDTIQPTPVTPIDNTNTSNGCFPMNIYVDPSKDADGNYIPVIVTTNLPKDYGTKSSPTTIDATANHTTGDQYTVTYSETRNWVSSYTPINDENGNFTGYYTPNYSLPRTSTSTIGPCYSYKLTPTIDINPSAGVIEANDVYQVTAGVDNAASGSYATHSKDTQWQVTKMVVPPGYAVPTFPLPGMTTADPCSASVYAPSGITCSIFAGGSQIFPKTSTAILMDHNKVVSEDIEVGTRICYGVSVKPNASNSPTMLGTDGWWRHTQPAPPTKCLSIGKKPKVQVHGGDLSVGKAFSGSLPNPDPAGQVVQTSTSNKIPDMTPDGPQFTFGSWIEYAIYATGKITGAGAGSYYANATGMPSVAPCPTVARALSFTLAADPTICGPIGGYKQARSIPNFAASFINPGLAIGSSPVVANNLPVSASKTYSYGGDLKLDASTLDQGKSVILKVDGTVTIAGDQVYNQGPFSRASQLPQLVIIAKNIIIDPGVKRVDAWLMATDTNGLVNTCSDGGTAGDLTSDICANQLVINGPVMAKKLYLRRTHGSGVAPDSGTPAEIINLRPDAYLWAQYQAASSGRIQTVYTTELPPRI